MQWFPRNGAMTDSSSQQLLPRRSCAHGWGSMQRQRPCRNRMNVFFRNDGTHLHIVCEGVWDPIELTDVARQIRVTADQMSHDKLLIDWTGVSAPSDHTYRILA